MFAILVALILHLSTEASVFRGSKIVTDDPILWGPAFGQQFGTYKLMRTLYRKPDFMVFGSSRVTQFRENMAPDNMSFYNASLAMGNLDDAFLFAKAVFNQHTPEIILLGIDTWWFNPGRSGKREQSVIYSFDLPDAIASAIKGSFQPKVLKSILFGNIKKDPDVLGSRRPVGYLAARWANGFRPDGSYQYGDLILGTNPAVSALRQGYKYDFEYYKGALRKRATRFNYVGAVNPEAKEMLRRFIELGQKQGVKIVLFFPPMAEAVYREMKALPGQLDYFRRVGSAVQSVARDTGTEFFDFHNLGELGVSDEHTLDGIHVDEIASLAVIRAMIEQSSIVGPLYSKTDRERLRKIATQKELWAGPLRLIP